MDFSLNLWKTYVCSLFHAHILASSFPFWNNEYVFNRLIFLVSRSSCDISSPFAPVVGSSRFQDQVFYLWLKFNIYQESTLAGQMLGLYTHTHTHAGTYPLKSAQISSQVGFLHIRRQPTCNFFSLTPPTQKKAQTFRCFNCNYYFPLHFLTFNNPKLKEHFFGCWWNETLIHRRKTYGVWYCGKDL